MTDTVICAICGRATPLDSDHARVDLTAVDTTGRNEQDDYVLCAKCTRQVRENWRPPA